MKQLNEKTIIVGPCRLSYLNAFKPRKNEEKDVYEYSATLLIPKAPHEHLSDPQSEVGSIAKVIKNILATKFGADFKGVWRNPLKDGDKELRTSDGEPKHPGYWFMNVRCGEDWKPKLIDGRKNPVTEGWNSGDWGLVKVSLYGYDQKGNKGVGCGLDAIQFLYKDEPFGGSGPSDEGFDEVAVAIPATGEEYDPFADE